MPSSRSGSWWRAPFANAALAAGRYEPLSPALVLWLTAAAVVLALATLLLIVVV